MQNYCRVLPLAKLKMSFRISEKTSFIVHCSLFIVHCAFAVCRAQPDKLKFEIPSPYHISRVPNIFNKKIPKPFQNSTLCHLTILPRYGIIIKIIEYTEKESKWRTLRL